MNDGTRTPRTREGGLRRRDAIVKINKRITPTLLTLTLGSCSAFKEVGELGDEGGEPAATSTGDMGNDMVSSTGVDHDDATASVSTGGTTSVDDDGDSTGTDTGTGGLPACEEGVPADPVSFHVSLGPSHPIDASFVEGWMTCTIVEAIEAQGAVDLQVDCDQDFEISIAVVTPAAFFANVSVDQQVDLFLATYPPDVVESYGLVQQWFVLRDSTGDLLLAGGSGNTLHPYIQDPEEVVDLFAPLSPSSTDGVCLPIEDECGTREPLLVDFGWGPLPPSTGATHVVDGLEYDVRLSEAAAYHDLRCAEVPGSWYEFVIANITVP